MKVLCAEYYRLRRQTRALGITDREFPRYYKKIGFEETITEKDRKRVIVYIEEERDYLRIDELYKKFDREATERDRSQRR